MTTTYQITKNPYGMWVRVDQIALSMSAFTFQTTWSGAADPNELHNKFQMLLTPEEMRRLAAILLETAQGSE